MKKSIYIWIAFATLSVIALAVPVSMIMEQQTILEKGKTFKFKTAPVDPVDVLRGRYVSLSFEQEHIPTTEPERWEGISEAYAMIVTDTNGYAIIDRLEQNKPEGEEYITVKINYTTSASDSTHHIFLSLPFDRFYLEEFKAPQADKLYFDSNTADRNNRPAYALIKIYNGKAAIEDVLIDDTPIQQILEKMAAEEPLP